MNVFRGVGFATLLWGFALVTQGAGHGVLLLTFDDAGNCDNWVAAMPLFEKYHAHATFFPDQWLEGNTQLLGQLQRLKDAGHTVGMHTVRHLHIGTHFQTDDGTEYIAQEIKPQVDGYASIGHVPRALAYPFNEHTAESDAGLMSKCGIRRFRIGCALQDVGFPVSEIFDKVVFPGVGIGETYQTDIDEIVARINGAADRNEVVVTFSHNICPDAKEYHMKTEWLERMLEAAHSRGMEIIGFDEIDALRYGHVKAWFDARIEDYAHWPKDADLAVNGKWTDDCTLLERVARLADDGSGLQIETEGRLHFSADKEVAAGTAVFEYEMDADAYSSDDMPPVAADDKAGLTVACDADGNFCYYGLARQGCSNGWVKLDGPVQPPSGKSKVRIAVRSVGDKLMANYSVDGWTYSYMGQADVEIMGQAILSEANVGGLGTIKSLSGQFRMPTGLIVVVR